MSAGNPYEPKVVAMTSFDAPVVSTIDPNVLHSSFDDLSTDFRRTLVDAIMLEKERLQKGQAEGQDQHMHVHSDGGWKVRSAQIWNSAEAKSLLMRCVEFVKVGYGQPEVHIRDRWANVMEPRQGWYSAPHSHSNADVAFVYLLQSGYSADEQEQEHYRGRLTLLDPRLPFCCPVRPQYATREFVSLMGDAGVITFPGYTIHWVPPYFGAEPRITIAVNLGFGPKPEHITQEQLEQQVQLPKGDVFNG